MLLKAPLIYTIIQRNVSALYTTGTIKPYLDFDAKLNNKQRLEQNIKLRNLNIDLNELNLLWSTYKDIEKRKSDLKIRRQEISDSIKHLDQTAKGSEDLMRKFKIEGTMARDDLKTLRDNSNVLEENFVHKFLDLPNDIHERTTQQDHQIHCSRFEHNIKEGENHLNKTDYLEYHDPYCYYLKRDAAICELNLQFYCFDWFRSFGFTAFCNPDFARRVLVEGAGVDADDLLTLIEENLDNKSNVLHLAGSGALVSYLGFLTKLLVHKSYLPLKFVSFGKQFTKPKTDAEPTGLYSACQTTNVQLFGMTTNESESLQQFDETVERTIELYKRLDRSFRVSYAAGHKLSQAENLKAVFEMYSPHRQCYIPIGHLSSYGDYISKRLLIPYKDQNQLKFSHLIAGSIINVTHFVAILLEEKGVFKTPTILENFK